MTRTILQPGPHHPISLHLGAKVLVQVQGEVIADGADAIFLKEANYPSVAYIDPTAIEADRLIASKKRTWCPYKGEADYFSWKTSSGEILEDAIWRYAEPHFAVQPIADRLAFHTHLAIITAP